MAQNSQRQSWTFEEVDGMLQDIMKNIFSESKEAASTYGKEDNLIAGANIAGFKKVADTMISQGLV